MPDAEKSTNERLAEALSAIKGMPPRMIHQAKNGYFNDFTSPLEFPLMTLVDSLQILASQPTTGPKSRRQLMDLMSAVMTGEYDATKEEAEAWMASEEGQAVMRLLYKQSPN